MMDEERRKLLQGIDFAGKTEEEIDKVCKEHQLTVDELAALRYLGKMSLFQYAQRFAIKTPWI